jgi:ankyrin repeat protein
MGNCTSTQKTSSSDNAKTNNNKSPEKIPTQTEDTPSSEAETPKKVSETRGPQPLNFKPIHSAIRWNKPVDEVEALLTSDEAVNCPDSNNGNCPIHIAAQNGHVELIMLLIRKKVNLNAQNGKGNTAVHMAIGYDYFQAATLLIEAGADCSISNELGFPASRGLEGDKCLGIAALVSAQTSSEAMKALELCNEDISIVDKGSFVAGGLKAKKAMGVEWTPEVQALFKETTTKL